MLSAFFKIIVFVIVILILLQLEYNGRKLQTYVVEYAKSLRGQKETIYIQEDPSEKKAIQEKQAATEKKVTATEKKVDKKTEKKTVKQAAKKTTEPSSTEPKKIKIIKQKADDQPEVTDEDRKELQQILK